VLPVLILTDQITDILTTRAVTSMTDLFINKGFESFGQGNIHRAHDLSLDTLAKFGKNFT
jgi:hypothetical protein